MTSEHTGAEAGNDDTVTDQVRRELLNTALLEARVGALPLIFTAGILAWVGWSAGQFVAAAAVMGLSVVVALWRIAMARGSTHAEPGLRLGARSVRAFEAHALATGLISATAAIFIYPAAQGIGGVLVIAAFAAMMSVATLFMTLAGRALAWYLVPQLLALFLVSLLDERVYSPLFAAAIPVFYFTLRRAARRHREAAELAIRRRIETDAVNVELRQAKSEAEAANVAKTQFLANMSHEVRTPMSGVLGAIDLLRSGEFGPVEQKKLLETAASSSRALLAVLNEVLDFAKLEAGRFALVDEPVAIRAVVASVVELFAPLAQSRGLSIGVDIDRALPVRVHGDAARIRQVLLNLIGNAVKFTDHGGVTVRVRVAGQQEGLRERMIFEIADTGIGIPAGALAELFAPFHQVDPSDTRRYGGTGLGLAISKRLVDAMGGEISVESDLGRGSTFRVSLPLKEARESTGDALAARQTPSPLSGKVLLVEDDEVNRSVGNAMLRALSLDVVEAGNGREAMERLAKEAFDLVLMDCQMPVMDGYAATREIRDRERAAGAPRTPIVAVTAHALSEDARRCLEAGMDAYLAKPYTRDQLRDVLAPWLAGA